MSANTLALLGGTPVINAPLEPYNKIGVEERDAARAVIDTGVLSGFVGAPCEEFDGGPKVQALEAAWCKKFNVKHAVSVNSATSGLYAAIGAAGIGPGDEVIVPPYTMSATAMAPLIYGAIPVFVDIEAETFCLDPILVEAAITPRTRAILAVNLFGHPAHLHDLRRIADRHGLILIEDNAQGPLATENGVFAGTIGHIGVFSLNRHKHIQTGEGGVCTTNDQALARKLELIRNHGENLVEHDAMDDITNMVGFNYRLTEISAAIGLAQLDKADAIVDERVAYADQLSGLVQGLDGITAPIVQTDCRHVYYVWAARIDESVIGVNRDLFVKALNAEGFPSPGGYLQPLYKLPVFQKRHAIGREGFPFNLSSRRYDGALCPTCEDIESRSIVTFDICSYQLSSACIERLGEIVHKVHSQRDALRRSALG